MNKYVKIGFLVVGLSIFYYILQNFGFNKILSNLENSGLTIFYAISVWFFAYLSNAYCYYEIVNDGENSISFAKAFKVSLAGFALNYVTPVLSLGGEAFRAIALKDEIGAAKGVSSTLLYNMLHILSHLFFWLTGAICIFFIYPTNITIIIAAAIAIICLSLAIAFLMAKHKNGVFKSLFKFKIAKKFLDKRPDLQSKLITIDDEIVKLYSTRKVSFYKGLAAEYAARVVASLEFYFILNGMNIQIDIFQAIYIHAISSLALNLTFFIPMELGAREASMYVIMGSIANDSSVGVFVAVINRIREFFWIFAGLIIMQSLKSGTKNSIQSMENNNYGN